MTMDINPVKGSSVIERSSRCVRAMREKVWTKKPPIAIPAALRPQGEAGKEGPFPRDLHDGRF